MSLELVVIGIVDVQKLLGHLSRMLIAIHTENRLEQLSHLISGLVPHGRAQIDSRGGIIGLWVLLGRLVQVITARIQLVYAAPIHDHALVENGRFVAGYGEDSLVLGQALELRKPNVASDPELREPVEAEPNEDGPHGEANVEAVPIEKMLEVLPTAVAAHEVDATVARCSQHAEYE